MLLLMSVKVLPRKGYIIYSKTVCPIAHTIKCLNTHLYAVVRCSESNTAE